MTHRALLAPCMMLIAALGLSGCASTWAIGYGMKGEPPFDENQRTQDVPLPGTTETLTVALVLHPPPAHSQSQTSTTSTMISAAALVDSDDLRFECKVVQHGRTRIYRAATRYGSTWKKGTVALAVIEGLIAAGFYSLIDNEETTPGNKLLAIFMTGWMGLDAVGTGVLYFMPQSEVYQTVEYESSIDVRSDCPEGLVLDVEGRTVPVNALGHVGALGQALLERYLIDSSPSQEPLRLRVGQRSVDMYLDAATRCAWAHNRQHESVATLCPDVQQASTGATMQSARVAVVMDVPPGTFTGPPPQPEPTPQPAQTESTPEAPVDRSAPAPTAPTAPTAP